MTPTELAAALLRNEAPVYGGARWHLHKGTVHLHSDGDAEEAYAMLGKVWREIDRATGKRGTS